MKKYTTAIIGGGAAGVMATLRSVLNNDETILFPGSPQDAKKSRALWVAKVENMPGYMHYKKGINDPNRETLQWLENGKFAAKFTWKKNIGITDIKKNADEIFELTDHKGEKYLAEYVVLATGVMDVQPKINGSIETIFPYANHQTIDYCLRCDGHHVLGKDTAVIGHDSGAAWVAIMLYERYQTPSMKVLTNGENSIFDEETIKLLKHYKIEVISDKIKEVLGDPKAGKLVGFKLSDESVVNTELAFVSLGMIVYNELALKVGAEVDKRGFVITNNKGESTILNFFIAGDLRAGIKKQIYTAWDSAVDTLDEINMRIRKARRNL
jgi:thioredoxin reductase (NADPH)